MNGSQLVLGWSVGISLLESLLWIRIVEMGLTLVKVQVVLCFMCQPYTANIHNGSIKNEEEISVSVEM